VSVERPGLAFIAAPAWLSGRVLALDARATAVKGSPQAGCVAPFAIPVCALYHAGEFSQGSLTLADRVFMRASRFCDTNVPGSPACTQILPEFFYEPETLPAANPVVTQGPTCSWSNPRFPEVSDHFGVVGLPESSGVLGEGTVRGILEKTSRPCVPARIGERFNVLAAGLTEAQTDQALWRQISVSYSGMDRSHPPYSSVYPATIVTTRPHSSSACASEAGWGACNSRRYVYNGVRGRTYFPEARFAHGFQPRTTEAGTTWPPVDADTPLWRVQVPVIAPVGATALDCPGGTAAGAEDEWVAPARPYEIIGFLTVNLFDTDIGRPPPLNPGELADGFGSPAPDADRVWGLNRARDTTGAGPSCYAAGAANGVAPECAPCNLVRGRVAVEIDFIAADQMGPPFTSLIREGRGSLCNCINSTCTEWRWRLSDGRSGTYSDPNPRVAEQLCEEGYAASV
jgi:hypothetical protein